MSEFKPGLEGVVAFETEIAEPDRDGGSLRYRGVDIEELVGSYRFEQVWGLLVDESYEPGLPVADPYEGGGLTGNTPVRPPVRDGAPRRRVGPEEADRHHRRRGARGSPPHLGAVHLDRGAVGADRRRQDRSNRPGRDRARERRPPSASCSNGAARPIRSTSRRSTPTGSAPASTASTPRPSSRGSPRPRARTAPRRSRRPSARSRARCTAARPPGCCRCSTPPPSPATPSATSRA